MDATGWILAHAQDLNFDPKRVAIAGDSAGGNLVTIMSAEFSDKVKYAVSVYPGSIAVGEHTASKELNKDAPVLPKATLDWFHYMHVGDKPIAELKQHPLFSPLNRLPPSPDAFPRTHVITAELDPLRDDGLAYVKFLSDAGIETTHTHYSSVHGFFGISIFPHGKEALKDVCRLISENV